MGSGGFPGGAARSRKAAAGARQRSPYQRQRPPVATGSVNLTETSLVPTVGKARSRYRDSPTASSQLLRDGRDLPSRSAARPRPRFRSVEGTGPGSLRHVPECADVTGCRCGSSHRRRVTAAIDGAVRSSRTTFSKACHRWPPCCETTKIGAATRPKCRPKSEDEISDLVDHQIRNYLPDVIVNREVQIRRLKPSRIGQRSDLLVQALAAGSTGRPPES